MRSHPAAALGLLVAVIAPLGCKDPKQEAARRSEAQVAAHVRSAREGAERLATTFVSLLEDLAPEVARHTASNDENGLRFALLGLHSRQTPHGSLTGFPTGFVAVANREGRAIARDRAAPDDLMRGMDLGALFPSVGNALAGNAGLSVGELPPSSDQPSRVVLAAAAPVRGPDGTVVGALVGGITYGHLARALLLRVRTEAGQRPVLWLGLHRNGRVLPSGRDRDVPELFLVPQPLIAQIPADWQARLSRARDGIFTWSFVEAGARGWGAGMGALPSVPDTRVVIFRSEAEQR